MGKRTPKFPGGGRSGPFSVALLSLLRTPCLFCNPKCTFQALLLQIRRYLLSSWPTASHFLPGTALCRAVAFLDGAYRSSMSRGEGAWQVKLPSSGCHATQRVGKLNHTPDPFSRRFREGISFPNFVERSFLKLPLSKICAVPFALQNRVLFAGENRAKRCPERREEEGWPAVRAKRKNGRVKQVRPRNQAVGASPPPSI